MVFECVEDYVHLRIDKIIKGGYSCKPNASHVRRDSKADEMLRIAAVMS